MVEDFSDIIEQRTPSKSSVKIAILESYVISTHSGDENSSTERGLGITVQHKYLLYVAAMAHGQFIICDMANELLPAFGVCRKTV